MQKRSKPLIKYFPAFLEYCELEKGLSEQTLKNYGRFLSAFGRWLQSGNLTNLKPHELEPDHIWQYRLWLSRRQNVKKTTQHYYLIALRNLLNYFTEKDTASLPANKVKLPKINQERKVKFLNLEQTEKLLSTPKAETKIGLRDRAILEVLFSTGLRIGELVALNREQFSPSVFHKKKDGFELAIVGKGGYPRSVYFSERALNWLENYLSTRADKEIALFINYNPGISNSRRLTAVSIERSVKRYAALAGLPIAATPHTLRHSYATDLLTQGVDLRLVQEFLGHRNIMTTQIYTHITKKYLKEIHRKYHSGNRLKND